MLFYLFYFSCLNIFDVASQTTVFSYSCIRSLFFSRPSASPWLFQKNGVTHTCNLYEAIFFPDGVTSLVNINLICYKFSSHFSVSFSVLWLLSSESMFISFGDLFFFMLSESFLCCTVSWWVIIKRENSLIWHHWTSIAF